MNAPLFRDVARPHDGNTGSLPVGIFGDAVAMPGWAVPEYSRNQVDRAGDALISDTTDWEDCLRGAEILDQWADWREAVEEEEGRSGYSAAERLHSARRTASTTSRPNWR